MSLPEVTYDWYTAEYGGHLGRDAFQALLPHAKTAVREVIGFNVASTGEQTEALKSAICAAAEVDAAYGGTGGTAAGGSFSIGSFSMGNSTPSTSNNTDYDMDMHRAIRGELVATGLLCQVIL